MKFLLKLFVVVASMIGIVLLIALFVDGSFEVKRSQTVPANNQVTFAFFKNLEHQEEFNAWLSNDPNTRIWYEGTPGEIGSKMCWSSSDKRVGKGTQEIVSIEENERIEYKITLSEPEVIEANLVLTTAQKGLNSTNVSWHLTGEVPYPWNLTLLFKDLENEIGIGFEKGMENARPLIVRSLD